MIQDIPQGQPFTLAYLKPSTLQNDSQQFRSRLSAAFVFVGADKQDVPPLLKLRRRDRCPTGFPQLSVGLTYEAMRAKGQASAADKWKAHFEQILAGEAMGYRVNTRRAVRKSVDEEFERSRTATIAGLGLSRYRSVSDFYQKALPR